MGAEDALGSPEREQASCAGDRECPVRSFKEVDGSLVQQLVDVFNERRGALCASIQRLESLVFNAARNNRMKELYKDLVEVEALLKACQAPIYISIQ